MASCQPFKTEIPVRLMIVTTSLLKSTEYLASYMGPIPTRFSWNPLMTCPLMGKSEGSSDDKANSHVVVDMIGGPVAAPTRMSSTLLIIFTFGASLVRKLLVAPESAQAVVRLSSLARRRAANFRLSLSHFAGPFKGVWSLTESGGTCTREVYY